jgi:hypothetical protein
MRSAARDGFVGSPGAKDAGGEVRMSRKKIVMMTQVIKSE